MENLEFLEKQAIKAAENEDWTEAVIVNKRIIRNQSKNITALNRLAWAYLQLNKPDEAKSSYKKVLEIDCYNNIAKKNLKKINTNNQTGTIKLSIKKISCLFLEEADKTKVVSLVKIADPKVIASLHCGEEIKLITKKRSVAVKDTNDRYLGCLPDDLSCLIIKLVNGGNRYQAWIKSLDNQIIQIFIRETYRCPKQKNLPSLPGSETNYIPYYPPEKVHSEKPEITPIEEEIA